MRWWYEPATRDFWQGLTLGLSLGCFAVAALLYFHS
jgi:hypothetical protein